MGTRKEKKAATEARIEKESLELAENIFKWAGDYSKKGEKDPLGKASKLATIKLQKDTKANPSETYIYKRIADRVNCLVPSIYQKALLDCFIKKRG